MQRDVNDQTIQKVNLWMISVGTHLFKMDLAIQMGGFAYPNGYFGYPKYPKSG